MPRGSNHILVETSDLRLVLFICGHWEDNHKRAVFVIIYDNITHSFFPVGFCRKYPSIRALYASPRGWARRFGAEA